MALAVFTGMVAVFKTEQRPLSRQFARPFSPEYPLYRALGHCELHLPAGSAGSFVPVGNSFDAFAALSKIFAAATTNVMIVDPYMDQVALIEFGLAVPEGVPLRLLADTNGHKATLKPAAEKWIAQYGTSRPLSVRIAPAKSLHDRAILLTGTRPGLLPSPLRTSQNVRLLK